MWMVMIMKTMRLALSGLNPPCAVPYKANNSRDNKD